MLLAERMQLLLDLVNRSEILLAVVNLHGELVACSEAIWRNSGQTRDAIVGQKLTDLHIGFPIHTPEQWSALLTKLHAEKEIVVESELGQLDGSTYRARFNISLQVMDGETYLLGIGHKMAGSTPLRSELEREARWRKALLDMATHESVTSGNVSAAADFITNLARGVLPAPTCAIWKRGETWAEVGQTAARQLGLEEYPWLVEELDTRAACDVLETGRTEEQWQQARDFLKASNHEALLLAPVRVAGEVWGLLTFGSMRKRQWTEDEFAFAAETASQMAHAVLNEARRHVEEARRVSEERYRSFLEMSQELVWRVEFDAPIPMTLSIDEQVEQVLTTGYVADCNDFLARFFGLERAEQLLGVRLTQVLAPINEQRRAEVRMMAETGFTAKNVPVQHHARGRDHWLLRNSQGVFEDGFLVQLWGAGRDITERKLAEDALLFSEQRYRAFVTNSSEGIFRIEYPDPVPVDLPAQEIVDRCWHEGRLVECNQALVTLRGYQRADQILGRPSTDFRMLTREEWQQEMDFVLGGFRISGLERPIRTASGAVKWFRYSALGIVADGKISGVWGTVSDVTDRKMLEEELRLLSARNTTILEQERARVAREIHDELGQQLTVLKFEAAAWENGKRKPVPGGLTKEIDAAIQSVRRIATELRPVILDQYGLAAAVEWQASEFSRRTGIECECTIRAELPVPERIATPVFRILQEGLTNAARHSEAQKVRVHLTRSRGRVDLEVHDNGKGLPQDGGRSASLGLAGMRERALDAGGTVLVSSVPGKGTVLSASFPVEDEE